MDNFNLSFGVEPTDNYIKAKKDLLQAIMSIQVLTPLERKHLTEEVFGAAYVASIMEAFSRGIGGN